MTHLHELAREAHEINTANGWGLNFNPAENDQEIPGYLALIHSEITEAWTAARPQEARRELGDVIVRALDLGELIRPGAWEGLSSALALPPGDLRGRSWAGDLLQLHTLTSEALEMYRKEASYQDGVLNRLHVIVVSAWEALEQYFPDSSAEWVVRDILAANRDRAWRHGGRRT